jgi:hypothetical protein
LQILKNAITNFETAIQTHQAPSAKPTSAMAVEKTTRRTRSRRTPYGVKKFVAQAGQTTNDKSTCEQKGGGKEQASTKQKGSPRHFVTAYPVRNELAAI